MSNHGLAPDGPSLSKMESDLFEAYVRADLADLAEREIKQPLVTASTKRILNILAWIATAAIVMIFILVAISSR